MKRLPTIICMCLLGLAAEAQDVMVLRMKNGTTRQYATERVDSVVWDSVAVDQSKKVRAVVYLNDQTTEQYAPSEVEDITWLCNDEPAPDIQKDGMVFTNPETFIVNENSTHIATSFCTIDMAPTLTDEDRLLTVRQSPATTSIQEMDDEFGEVLPLGKNAKVIDLDFSGIHNLDGIVTIRIPYTAVPSEKIGAAYYNETAKEWESVCYYYDKENQEVVILTDHLSVFSTFSVTYEHTRKAKVTFNHMPYENPEVTPNVLYQLLSKALKKGTNMTPEEALEWAEEAYGTCSTLANDVYFNLVKTAGIEREAYETLGDVFTYLGYAYSLYEVSRKAKWGEASPEAGYTTMKLLSSQISGAAIGLLKTGISGTLGFAVALVDYALNKFYESKWEGRTDMYRAAYNAYYSKVKRPGMENNYRSSPQWYKLLLPVFTKENQTIEDIHEEVDRLVTDYCNEFWTDENRVLEYFVEVTGKPNTEMGGLNQSMKETISKEHRTILYTEVLPLVFSTISDKLYYMGYDRVANEMTKYAKHMNEVIVLKLKDGNVTDDKSVYAGNTVRFKSLPKTLTDPKDWECSLNDKGDGIIKFRLYPFIVEGVKPLLELVDDEGKVVKEVPFTVSLDNTRNIINLNENNLKGFVLKSVDKENVNYSYTSYGLPLYIGEEKTDLYVDIYTTWNDEQIDIASIPFMLDYVDKSIKKAFTMNPCFNYSPNGTFMLDNDVLKVNGRFVQDNITLVSRKGEGTFSINFSNILNVKTQDEVTGFWQNPNNYLDRYLDFYNPIMNGNVKHTLNGTFTFEWNEIEQAYIFKFGGSGSLEFNGVVYNWISNLDFGNYGGFANPNPGAVCTNTEDVTVKGKTTMDFEIKYELVE